MTVAVIVMMCIGATCAIILSVASKVFYVYEDPRISEIEYFMAGANCGGCGYAGCSAAALAIVHSNAPTNICIVGGNDSAIEIAKIMGVETKHSEPQKSINPCFGGNRAENKFLYNGVNSCSAMSLLYGGQKLCSIGCLTLGDCVKSCKFNAISIDHNKTPVINELKCVGCGACEQICPKKLIKVKSMSQRLLNFNDKDSALAPCQQACPAEIDIPSYIASIKSGNYKNAIRIIKERNPFPLSCGRVCPHPCESHCRRGIEDAPVSINQLKRFVADYEMNNNINNISMCAPSIHKKIAIIGGGPAGLSAAYFLRKLGYNITIYEAMPKLGGILRYGIPEYRLPKKILDWDIKNIINLGIEYHCKKKLGKDFTIQSLRQNNFDAIFISIGAWSDYKLKVDGENMTGCWQGIEFLSSVANNKNVIVGQKVAVIGGGNSAIDCVRTLTRLGAKTVTIVYRRTETEMPANKAEIEAAKHEGINFLFLAAPVRVIGNKDNHITHLEYIEMKLGEPDSSGRRRPIPIENSETKLEIDMLITAIGQRPNINFIKNEKDNIENLKITKWGTFENNPEVLQTNIPHIFTAGDCATGPSLVVEAIGGARRASNSIHHYLTNNKTNDTSTEVTFPIKSLRKKFIQNTIFNSVHGINKIPRTTMPELPVKERINSMIEVDLTISEKDAIHESKRCLDCCRLCYNKDIKTNKIKNSFLYTNS